MICDGLKFQVVTMCSTAHSANGSRLVHRRFKVRGVNQQQQVRKPDVIYYYNQNMAGVDKSDQKIATYNVLIKSVRYSMFIC